jgi:NitT/TauT family transport system ATP-binding protein
MNPILSLRGVSWERPSEPGSFVLRDVSFEMAAGNSVAIVGRSGRGKSTLLRVICGLEQPTSGEVHFQGQRLTGTPRGLGIVFQDFEETVFNWLTIRENVLLGSETPRDPATRERAEALAVDLGLKDHLRKRWSAGLSGGERQRVAIARTLLHNAELVLLDEPFSSLDTVARHDLIQLIAAVSKQHNTTFLIISHDIEEALYATGRVYCLLRSTAAPQLRPFEPAREMTQQDEDSAQFLGVIQARVARITEILRGDTNAGA